MATATRLFIPQDLQAGRPVEADPDQAHYLSRVLRLGAGAPLVLFNGRDGEWDAVVTEIGKNRATLRPETQRRAQVSSPDVWLAFAPVKKTQTDFIVQKATELGVSRLIPILTDRTQSERVRTDRLTATAVEAAEQCERLDVPVVVEPIRLDRLIDTWPTDRMLYLCAEAGDAQPLASAAKPGPAAFVTGPEGGFSQQELDLMRRSPLVQPISLGPRILRAETAAMAALAVWQAVSGDWGGRPPPRG
ncbi:16S rRNA (uracil(1498)-N(3))-methyltransferase [Rhodospirillaceae bacterium KN72]|uniref:Ribosomal RNA small subunit methyltransferase E n=1 Tax=Pacificispira spongiicola TaxID=2729598 RepID=A0A7Y0HFA1_9PROT|nr:16S rRNA (uracil(1498)-N(3))-methyltransferase [Pacificispira spongiicola]NMM43732.1 16S rRNA (uracil(1498)-N(3))-methyltransferase [Pacificispira spongiicola]